jgi:hypothetical protein
VITVSHNNANKQLLWGNGCGFCHDALSSLDESKRCLIAVQIIELLTFDYCYDWKEFKALKTYSYQTKR